MPLKPLRKLFFSLFNNEVQSTFNRTSLPKETLLVDMHAHLLPSVDDGPVDLEQSLEVLAAMAEMGYKKVILTPHIMSGYYQNKPSNIMQAFNMLQSELKIREIKIDIEVAAEYYLEDNFFEILEYNTEDILSFGDNKKYLLFEASLITPVNVILDAGIRIKKAGYIPVIAHPERYINLNNIEDLKHLSLNGILFQLNIGSFLGEYNRNSQELATQIVKHKLVSFLGTDCHHLTQLKTIKQVFNLPIFNEILKQNLLNNSLITSKSTVSA